MKMMVESAPARRIGPCSKAGRALIWGATFISDIHQNTCLYID